MVIKIHTTDLIEDGYTIDVVTLDNERHIESAIEELNNVINVLNKLKEK